MIMKVCCTKVNYARIITVVAHTGETFVQFSFVVLEILEDALNVALFCLWCHGLETDVLQCDV